jgi:hypothetical protein
MQQAMQPPKVGHPVLANSFIFGGILAGLNIVNLIVEVVIDPISVSTQVVNGTTTVNIENSGIAGLLTCFLFLAALVLSFIAGMLTARASGKIGAATLAGLLCGLLGTLVAGIIGLVVTVVIALPTLKLPPGSTLSQGDLPALLVATAAFELVFGLIITAGLGAGTGALGGLVGRSSYRPPMAVPGYSPFPYQGMPGMGESQPIYPYQQPPTWSQPQWYPEQPTPLQQPMYPPPPPTYPGPFYPGQSSDGQR